jgi:apolipoprotein D and lipocalin family protein
MMSSAVKSRLMVLLGVLGLGGCTGIPPGVEAVEGFEIDRYLGKWYEIARLDHRFERGLTNVSATYTLRGDGGIDVLNRGFNPETGTWKEAKGKAYFVEARNRGRLKVSFFGPFYGGYNVIGLDTEAYSWSLVCGPKRSYFWILAREPELEPALREELVRRAASLGFDTKSLVFPAHGPIPGGR